MIRAANKLFVFKDGTVRFDIIDMPLTHFRPREIGVSVERLRELGYLQDIYGVPLQNPDQVLELPPGYSCTGGLWGLPLLLHPVY